MPTRISSSLIKPLSGSSNTNLGQDVSDLKTSVQSLNTTVSTNTSDISSLVTTVSSLQSGGGGSGVQVVTSTTRPSTADQGTIIYETDTQKSYINTGTQNSPSWTEVATSSYVSSQGYITATSPALTGTPTAPTASSSDDSTKIATTAFVKAQGYATTSYVDGVATGLDIKASVRVATTENLTVSASTSTTLTLSSALTTIDGVTLSNNDRILLKDQATASQNGIYVRTSSTLLTRSTDADNTPSNEVTAGMFTFVTEGSTNADSGWVLTTSDSITLGTTSLAFSQFSGAGQIIAGTGITKSGNTLSITSINASKAVVSDSSGNLTASSVTSTELGYVSGVTSAIQTQLDGKQDSITGGASTITTSNLTASKALVSDASGKVSVSSVTASELAYVSGVTSPIQTQLNYLQDLVGYTITYTYTNSQLTSETIYDKAVPPALIKSTTYTYDANGNLSTQVTSYGGRTSTKTITYDANDNILSVDVTVT